MEVKVGLNSLQWPQPIIPRSLSSHIPPSSISSFSLTAHTPKNRALAYSFIHRSSLLGSRKSRYHILNPACSARLYEFSDEEFSKQIEELAQKFHLSKNMNDDSYLVSDTFESFRYKEGENSSNMAFMIPFSERREGFREGKDYTYCSVSKAFSSMVFIIRELQSHMLHIREILYCEDLHKIITRVQRDMHASFVWLFQQVFSQTPTLMVYVMILLANFTVYSMGYNTAIAATPSPRISYGNTTETVSVREKKIQEPSIGGNSGDGGKVRPVASGTEGGDRHLGRSTLSIQYPNVVPDEISSVCSFGKDELTNEEDVSLWNSMVEEALRMESELRDEVLDHEMVQRFVSPVSVELEQDDYVDYFKTEFLYQMNLSQDPYSPLLLSNYAQFLYLVAHKYDRAEECFKRAVELEPPDAEVLSQYANFLWMVRKDLWGAEERYQQAMAAEPDNPYHASKYASFLWSTGGEDTCFPLNTSYNNYNA